MIFWTKFFLKKWKYLSSIFKGLCEKAFRIELFPLFIECGILFGIVWWLPFAITIGDEDDGRIPFGRLFVEKGFAISLDRSSIKFEKLNFFDDVELFLYHK